MGAESRGTYTHLVGCKVRCIYKASFVIVKQFSSGSNLVSVSSCGVNVLYQSRYVKGNNLHIPAEVLFVAHFGQVSVT